jgi:hypothetical protein
LLTLVFFFTSGIPDIYRIILTVPNFGIVNAMACKVFCEMKFTYSGVPMAFTLSSPPTIATATTTTAADTATTPADESGNSHDLTKRKCARALGELSVFKFYRSVDKEMQTKMKVDKEAGMRGTRIQARDTSRSTDERDSVLTTTVRRPVVAFLNPISSFSSLRSTVRSEPSQIHSVV